MIARAGMVRNKDLQSYIKELENKLKAAETNLINAKSAFSLLSKKSLPVYVLIGAVLTTVVYGVRLVLVFMFGGKLYSVANIRRTFTIDILWGIAEDKSKNPVDKMIFRLQNGRETDISLKIKKKQLCST